MTGPARNTRGRGRVEFGFGDLDRLERERRVERRAERESERERMAERRAGKQRER